MNTTAPKHLPIAAMHGYIHVGAVQNYDNPCPLANGHNYPKTSTRKRSARLHSLSHLGIKFARPVAEEYKCDSVLTTKKITLCYIRKFIPILFYLSSYSTGCYRRFLSFERCSATCRGSTSPSCKTLPLSCSDVRKRHDWASHLTTKGVKNPSEVR